MDFLIRAWKQNIRKPMKSLMIFLVMFVISNLMVTGIFILKGTEKATEATLSKITPIVYYVQDYDKFYRAQELGFVDFDSEPMPPITLDTAKEIGTLPDVKVMDIGTNYSVYIPTLTAYKDPNSGDLWEEWEEDGDIEVLPETKDTDDGLIIDKPIEQTYFEIIGTSSSEFKVLNGTISIEQGRGITTEDITAENNVVMIEERLANENNLSVGDKFVMNFRQVDETTTFKPEEQVEVEVEVIGIFKNLATQTDVNPWSNERAANQLYMPYNVTLKFGKEASMIQIEQGIAEGWMTQEEADTWSADIDNYSITTVGYTLNDPLKVQDFTMDAEKYLPSEYHVLKVADSTYNSIAKSISGMTETSNLIIYIVFGAGVLILSLITSLTLKSREYEIGVLLSLGESKLKVIGQLLSELLIIALVAFTLSIVSGNFIAKSYGQNMLQSQMEAAMSTMDNNYIYVPDQMYTENESSLSYSDFVNNFNISLEPMVYVQLMGYGMLVVAVSAIVPIAFIMRYNPKAILTIR
ncbi:MAG TPA: ABC transporter permease [Firmicutes bacterium]|nr:ABC transporter permease [Bacillota bacterium]